MHGKQLSGEGVSEHSLFPIITSCTAYQLLAVADWQTELQKTSWPIHSNKERRDSFMSVCLLIVRISLNRAITPERGSLGSRITYVQHLRLLVNSRSY